MVSLSHLVGATSRAGRARDMRVDNQHITRHLRVCHRVQSVQRERPRRRCHQAMHPTRAHVWFRVLWPRINHHRASERSLLATSISRWRMNVSTRVSGRSPRCNGPTQTVISLIGSPFISPGYGPSGSAALQVRHPLATQEDGWMTTP